MPIKNFVRSGNIYYKQSTPAEYAMLNILCHLL